MPEEKSRRPELVALGHAVRARRVERGITASDLADEAGVSRRYLEQIERGQANPTVGVLLRVGEALGVRISALIALAEPDTDD